MPPACFVLKDEEERFHYVLPSSSSLTATARDFEELQRILRADKVCCLTGVAALADASHGQGPVHPLLSPPPPKRRRKPLPFLAKRAERVLEHLRQLLKRLHPAARQLDDAAQLLFVQNAREGGQEELTARKAAWLDKLVHARIRGEDGTSVIHEAVVQARTGCSLSWEESVSQARESVPKSATASPSGGPPQNTAAREIWQIQSAANRRLARRTGRRSEGRQDDDRDFFGGGARTETASYIFKLWRDAQIILKEDVCAEPETRQDTSSFLPAAPRRRRVQSSSRQLGRGGQGERRGCGLGHCAWGTQRKIQGWEGEWPEEEGVRTEVLTRKRKIQFLPNSRVTRRQPFLKEVILQERSDPGPNITLVNSCTEHEGSTSSKSTEQTTTTKARIPPGREEEDSVGRNPQLILDDEEEFPMLGQECENGGHQMGVDFPMASAEIRSVGSDISEQDEIHENTSERIADWRTYDELEEEFFATPQKVHLVDGAKKYISPQSSCSSIFNHPIRTRILKIFLALLLMKKT